MTLEELEILKDVILWGRAIANPQGPRKELLEKAKLIVDREINLKTIDVNLNEVNLDEVEISVDGVK
jgi:hypothetical protein